jgi:hypothetical protein
VQILAEDLIDETADVPAVQTRRAIHRP